MDTPTLIARILLSKKLIYAAVPVVANALAGVLGFDPSHQALLVLDAFFAILLVVQGILDIRYGSASDGTVGQPPTVSVSRLLSLASVAAPTVIHLADQKTANAPPPIQIRETPDMKEIGLLLERVATLFEQHIPKGG